MLVKYIEEDWGRMKQGQVYKTEGFQQTSSGGNYHVNGYWLMKSRFVILSFNKYVKCLK